MSCDLIREVKDKVKLVSRLDRQTITNYPNCIDRAPRTNRGTLQPRVHKSRLLNGTICSKLYLVLMVIQEERCVTSLVFKKVTAIVCVFYEKRRLKTYVHINVYLYKRVPFDNLADHVTYQISEMT